MAVRNRLILRIGGAFNPPRSGW